MVPPLIAFLIVGVLGTYNLVTYPVTWFDEGVFLVAARTLAQTGFYATQSVDGLKLFDAMVTTGPTVIAPVALVFKLFGVGLAQARLVAVVYLLLGALGLFRVANQLYGNAVGTLSILVFASLGEAGAIVNGRNVLGEIAAITYLLWGASLFVSAQQTGRIRFYLLSGLLLGLAVLTKNQFIILAPVLVGLWATSRSQRQGFAFGDLCLMLTALAAPTVLWSDTSHWSSARPDSQTRRVACGDRPASPASSDPSGARSTRSVSWPPLRRLHGEWLRCCTSDL